MQLNFQMSARLGGEEQYYWLCPVPACNIEMGPNPKPRSEPLQTWWAVPSMSSMGCKIHKEQGRLSRVSFLHLVKDCGVGCTPTDKWKLLREELWVLGVLQGQSSSILLSIWACVLMLIFLSVSSLCTKSRALKILTKKYPCKISVTLWAFYISRNVTPCKILFIWSFFNLIHVCTVLWRYKVIHNCLLLFYDYYEKTEKQIREIPLITLGPNLECYRSV